MNWLRLIRWKNLLIIFLTQLLAWGCVIMPGSPEVLTPLNFFCLSLSTVLIAAAGYIINDYFDIKIDLINRPQKVVLETAIPRKQAIISHTVLNLIALMLAAFIAAQAHHYEWLFMQLCCTALLWFYSTNFKRQYITGNLVVALLTALTIFILIVYEPTVRPGFGGHSLSAPGWVLMVYAYFAFMLTWMREIVKDMEDHIGDEAEGCVTMPVKKGLKFSANFAIALGIIVILPLIAGAVKLYQYNFSILAAYVVVLVISIIWWSVFLFRGPSTMQHYGKASRGLKIIMLLGVISLLIYYFQISSQN